MIEPTTGEPETRCKIGRFEIRHLGEDIRARQAGGGQIKDIAHPNPHAANTGTCPCTGPG